MKNIIYSLLVLSTFTFVNAQNEINGGPVNIPAEGVIDGIYIQEHIPTKRLVPYEFVREADVMFQKRIWRSIDMREKINHPMYYPMDEFTGAGDWVKNTTRWSLWTVIRHHIMKGDLVMYDNENPNNIGSFDGDLFKYPVQLAPGKSYENDTTFKDNVLRLIATKKDKVNADGTPMVKTDPMTGEPINYSVARLQSYYYAWRDFLVKKKDVISYFDSTNYSAILLKENIANTKVYILLNIQFKPNKLQIICENHGVVRTVDNPYQTAFTFGELFKNEKSLSIEQKKKAIDAYTNSLNKLPVDLMDFILDDKDFVNRAESDLLQFTPSFNF